MQLFTNNAASKLVSAISNVALSLQVKSGEGAKFPSPTGGDFFLVTLCKVTGGVENTIEIVKCTARTGDSLTIVRGQEGTTPNAYAIDDRIELRMTAGTAAATESHINNTSNPHAVTKAQVGLDNVDNTSDANKPISTATQTALDLKAPLASPTFTGTVGGITKAMVGLGNVDNTSDANKPVSTATQTALDLKYDKTGGTLTGNVTINTGADSRVWLQSGGTTQLQLQATAALTRVSSVNNLPLHLAVNGTDRLSIDGTGYMAIGATPVVGQIFKVGRALDGATAVSGIRSDGQVQSAVTSSAAMFLSAPGTQAASFTLGQLNHYRAFQGTFGVGSVVTEQNGFIADSGLIDATNNYGFRGLLTAGTGRYNLYMSGTAANYLAGALSIGTTTDPGTGGLYVAGNATLGDSSTDTVTVNGAMTVGNSLAVTGALSASGNATVGGAASGNGNFVTLKGPTADNNWAGGLRLYSNDNTTVRGYIHASTSGLRFSVDGGATIVSQIDSTGLSVTGALSASGNATLGDASTDTVTVNGYMGVGGAALTRSGIALQSSALSGTSQYGFESQVVGTSGATTQIVGHIATPGTAAASFTVTDLIGFKATEKTKGAGSTITNQHGVYVGDMSQGANIFGITSTVSSGANKWNIYASGTAANYFAGNVGIGTSSQAGRLNVGTAINSTNTVFSGAGGAFDLRLTNGDGSVVNSELYRLQLIYNGTQQNAFIGFNRSSGATGGSLTFGTGASAQVTLDASGNLSVVGTVAATGGITGVIADSATVGSTGVKVGYRNVPQNAQSGNYTLALTDDGKHIYSANAGAQTITLPTNASVAFPIGASISLVNNGTTAITLTTTGTTVYKSGTSTAWASGGTLGVRGLATFLKVATDTWFVSGAGLS